MWDYEDALAWLYARQGLGIKLGLDKVKTLLARLGDPQQSFSSVHIAGTNGKGTVTHLLSETLRRSGHKTGRFTSPHLIRFTERIAIDGVPISEPEVAAALHRIRPVVEALDEEGHHATFFEVASALAFLAFKQAGVTWAVVETGMGGRLDATNVLQPALTIITHIGLDHEQFLGASLADITFEKAGIMKDGVPLVTAVSGEALLALKTVSHARHVPMSVIGEDYQVLPDINGLRLLRPAGDSHYALALAGEHQLRNAAMVVAACDALRAQGETIPESALQQALAETTVPGRLERLAIEPGSYGDHGRIEVLLDGAHNESGAQALRFHLGQMDWGGFELIVGFSKDKRWQAMLDQWQPLASHVRAVPLRSGRSLEPAAMQEHVERAGFLFVVHDHAHEALRAACNSGASKIVIAGSLFLVGECRAILLDEALEEIRGDQ